MSTPITELNCLEMGRLAFLFNLSVPNIVSEIASLTVFARVPKTVAAFSSVSSASTDVDAPALELALTSFEIPLTSASMQVKG